MKSILIIVVSVSVSTIIAKYLIDLKLNASPGKCFVCYANDKIDTRYNIFEDELKR